MDRLLPMPPNSRSSKMGTRRTRVASILLTVFAALVQFQTECCAETRKTQSLPEVTLAGTGTSLMKIDPGLIARPSYYRDGDVVYQKYFASMDRKLELMYSDRWAYHDMQLPYSLADWNYEHLSIGTTDRIDHGPYEGDVRHAFAQQVLRMRIDQGIKTYFADSDRAQDLKKAQQTFNNLNKIKDIPIAIGKPSPKTGPPAQIRVGYDVQNDNFKFEYDKPGGLKAGLYHSKLMGNPKLQLLAVKMSTPLGDRLPHAGMSYLCGSDFIELSLSQPLTRRLTTSVMTHQPLSNDRQVISYNVSFNISF